MKIHILLLASIISVNAYCQEVKNEKKKKITLGISISPKLCHTSIDRFNLSDERIEELKARNKPCFGYSFGLSSGLNLNSKWSYGINLLFSKNGYKTNEYFYATGSGFIWYMAEDLSNYSIELPLSVKRSFNLQKFRIFGKLGIGPFYSFHSKNKIATRSVDVMTQEVRQGNTILYNDGKHPEFGTTTRIGIGITTNVKPNILLNIETFHESTSPLIAFNYLYKPSFYSFGVCFEIYFLRMKINNNY
jgi:hypothetical protein